VCAVLGAYEGYRAARRERTTQLAALDLQVRILLLLLVLLPLPLPLLLLLLLPLLLFTL